MFKFSNIKKLFSYNFGKDLKTATPKGNKSVMQESAYKDIRNGAILRILAVVFSQIAAIGIAVYTVASAYSWLGGDILGYAFGEVFKENAIRWLLQILAASIVPIIILIYIRVMKNKEQHSWPLFVLLIISLLQTLYSLYSLIAWFAGFIVNPLFAILGIVSVLMILLGNVHISVGCIDYCLKAGKEFLGENPTINQGFNYQPGANNQNMTSGVNGQNFQQPMNNQQQNIGTNNQFNNINPVYQNNNQPLNNVQQGFQTNNQTNNVNPYQQVSTQPLQNQNNNQQFQQPINNQQQNLEHTTVISNGQNMNQSKTCQRCGTINQLNAIVCSKCGNII